MANLDDVKKMAEKAIRNHKEVCCCYNVCPDFQNQVTRVLESAIHTYRQPLVEALRKYGCHIPPCMPGSWDEGESLDCSCGFSEILEAEEQPE